MTKQERTGALLEKRRIWQQHIQSWQASGSTQISYCRCHDLKFHRFVYWKNKFNPKADARSSTIVELPMGLDRLVLSQPGFLRLAVGEHYRIEVCRDFDPVALRQLLHVLGQL